MTAGRTNFVARKSLLSFKTTLILPLLVLWCFEGIVLGQLTLSPMSVAPVCRVGDPLQITCTASVQAIRWSIFRVIDDQGTLSEITNSVLIDNRDANQRKSKEVAATTFTYARTSAQFASPLISTLSIDSVGIGLNGTVVNCSDVLNPTTSASTAIYISAANSTVTLNQYTPSLNISEEYDVNNVTVTVEWTQQAQAGDLISYNVSVSPPVSISYNGNTSLNLVLEYNFEYDLSVEANIRCKSNATASITLNYVACEHPPLNVSLESSLNVMDYKEPAINGTMVSFNCSQPGQVLIGPSTATCMEDGQWAPNPDQLQSNCKVSCGPLNETNKNVIFSTNNSTLEGSTISFRCIDELMGTDVLFTSKCFRNASWVPDPISQCAVDGERGTSHKSQTVTITGSLFGVLAVIVLLLLAVVGTVIFVKKGSLWRPHRRNMVTNFELHKKHKHTVYEQKNKDVKDDVVYAVLGPLSSNQSQNLMTSILNFDDNRVEYAKINYNITVPQNPLPISSVEKPAKSDKDLDMSLNLDILLIQLKDKVTEKWHQFGEALGVEKEILDRCLNYPPEQSIVEVLDYWLRSCDLEERNWRNVAKALRQIEHHQLAEEIETIDKTEPDDVPDNVLQNAPSESDPAINESPPPKNSKDIGNPEDFQHGDFIRFNLPI